MSSSQSQKGKFMKVLIADNNRSVITAVEQYDPTFDFRVGNPLAYDIDAVVSPANTKGIMNGGFDAVLRRFFGTIIEVRARQYLEKHPLDVGQAAAIKTSHKTVRWLIISPTVSIKGNGFSGNDTVAYACGYNSVIAANRAGATSLGMTGLGTGAGALDIRHAIKQQCDGIEDALYDISHGALN